MALGVAGVPFSEYVKLAGKTAGSIAKAAKRGADAEKTKTVEPPLSQLKAELADALSDLDHPVLIVIDDIDRLTTEEVREVFNLQRQMLTFRI